MRIIAGRLGGRSIRSIKGDARPAMGKTREALFSMLCSRGFEFADARVLDLFAGTGSLGFEALSRGAARVDFVDDSAPLCELLRENARDFGAAAQCGVYREQARRFLSRSPAGFYDLIFIDPPYRRNLLNSTLSLVLRGGFARSGSIICVETEKGAQADAPEALGLVAERSFGQTMLNIWMMK